MQLPKFTPGLGILYALTHLHKHGKSVDPGHWQGIATGGKPDLVTKELVNLSLRLSIPEGIDESVAQCKPNIPWAEIEFQERVGGEPHNPHNSLPDWPWWHGQWDQTTRDQTFDHTYSERFWPKHAGSRGDGIDGRENNYGLRYDLGDLSDVIALLRKYPDTRQATFPIFFPEDTGAVHGGRIPCTLHYHFMLRNGKLHLWYPIRSCDAVRHFRDDVYMAMRLCQWVILRLREMPPGRYNYGPDFWKNVRPGTLHFTAYSFHVHMGDYHHLEAQL